MNYIKDIGIIIGKKDYGEADRVITVFSKENGRIEFYLKNIKKSKNRGVNSYETMSFIEFTFYKKGDKFVLVNGDLLEYYLSIRGDIRKLGIVYYIFSLLNNFILIGEKKSELFNRLKNGLEFIEKNDIKKIEFMLVRMLHWILKYEGYHIPTFQKKTDNKISNKNIYNLIINIENKQKIDLEDITEAEIHTTISLYEKYLKSYVGIEISYNEYIY